jgi:hypothetical protein
VIGLFFWAIPNNFYTRFGRRPADASVNGGKEQVSNRFGDHADHLFSTSSATTQ